MASSGWQGQKDIQTSKYPHMALNLNVWDVNHSGTNVTFKATVRAIVTSGNLYYNNVGVSLTGGGSISKNMNPVSSGGYVDFGTYSCTVSNVATSATTCNVTASLNAGSTASGSATWTLSFSASGTAPTGLGVTLKSVQDTGATMAVTLSSYGTPSSEANRYIEAAIMGQSTYGGKYRWATSKAATSATITVNNNSATNSSNPLTIVPNTQYWYGAYATNTVMSTSMVKGTFITLPAYIKDVTVNDVGGGEVTVSVIHASEGTATTAYTEYSYNQTDWTVVQDTFSLTVHSATTIYIRRRNSTGTTPVRTVSIVPATTVKLYGSVNNQAKEICKLYGSVNGKAVRIRKLYGSVNGRSKLIFEDNS